MLRIVHSGLAAPLLLRRQVPVLDTSITSTQAELGAATGGLSRDSGASSSAPTFENAEESSTNKLPIDPKDIIEVALDDTIFGRGRIGRVFKGTMDGSIRIIVKMVFPNERLFGQKLYPKEQRAQSSKLVAELMHEGGVYMGRLKSLQGTVVPHCYGYFENECGGCLLLEDCGDALTFPYRQLPLEDRKTLFDFQVQLHTVGVSHGDVARRNFVKGPRGIRLIDLDKAVSHECLGFREPPISRREGREGQCRELEKHFVNFGLAEDTFYTTREREMYTGQGHTWYTPSVERKYVPDHNGRPSSSGT